MNKLYVCDIAPTINSEELKAKFSAIGPLHDTEIHFNKINHTPRYAFITYENHEDAERAIEELNYEEKDGIEMRIMWSKKNTEKAPVGMTNTVIKGLKPDVTNKLLSLAMSQFGNIFSCKVPLVNEESTGYGYVNYQNEEDAKKAIEKNGENVLFVDGKELSVDGKLNIEYFHTNRNKTNEEGNLGFTNVYIKNFGDNLTDESLKELFLKYGQISSASVMRNSNGSSKGFGFVDFVNHKDAVEAVRQLNGTCLPGTETKLYVGRAQKKSERRMELDMKYYTSQGSKFRNSNSKTKLFISNLHNDVNDQVLLETFEQYGKVMQAKVEVDQSGKSKGYGFVQFFRTNDASLAFRSMRTRSIMGQKIILGFGVTKKFTPIQNQSLQPSNITQVPYYQSCYQPQPQLAIPPQVYHQSHMYTTANANPTLPTSYQVNQIMPNNVLMPRPSMASHYVLQ